MTVDWAPAHELLISLRAYISRPEQRVMDLGREWASEVRTSLSEELAVSLDRRKLPEGFPAMEFLVEDAPGPRTPESFLTWVEGLSVGEMYERLAPRVPQLPRDLSEAREQFVRMVGRWNEEYFRSVDAVVLSGLATDAERQRQLITQMSSADSVETITNGVCFVYDPSPEEIRLIPQYHMRPWNLFSDWIGRETIWYSADAVPETGGDPPLAILRVTRALSDTSRLRILSLVAEEVSSLTDIARRTGLAKSTVYHHLVVLRAAGLVRVMGTIQAPIYGLRPSALQHANALLNDYLGVHEGEHG